jgi:very-short-patch-repair endonuclease
MKGENSPNYGQHQSPETCKKKSDALRGKTLSPETCKKIGDAKRNPSAETRKKIGDANRNRSSETRKKLREAQKELWQDSEYVAKQMKARQVSQNKLEKFLQTIINSSSPGLFRFVGDGQLIIAGKCPDFVHTSRPLLIELFGDYWHGQAVTGIPEAQHEQERIKLFESQGYKTLVIWEHELTDTPKLLVKLANFIELGN